MKISIIDDTDRGSVTGCEEVTFEDFLEMLSSPSESSDKHASLKYSLATFKDGRRTNDTALTVETLVFDFDDVPEADFLSFISSLEGLRFAAHSTWSDKEEAEDLRRFRVFIELDKAVPAPQWKSFWDTFTKSRGISLRDRSGRDPGRYFYAPVRRAGRDFEYLDWRSFSVSPEKAKAFPVDTITAHGAARANIAENGGGEGGVGAASVFTVVDPDSDANDGAAPTSLDPQEMRAWIAALMRTRGAGKENDEITARVAQKVLDGLDWGTPGDRHGAMLSLTMRMASRFRHVSTSSIVDFIMPSVEAAARAGSKTPETRESIYRMVSDAKKKIAEQDRIRLGLASIGKALVAQSEGQNGAAVEKTETTLTRTGEIAGLGREPLDTEWVIQKRDTYYFLTRDGGYTRGYDKTEALTLYRRLLTDTPVKLFKQDERGEWVPRSFGDILQSHASVAHEVRAVQQKYTTYDPARRTVDVGVCWPVIEGTGQFSEVADAYLRTLFSRSEQSLEAGMQWVAAYLNTTLTLPILFLIGKKHSGKSTLVRALAECYGMNTGTPVEKMASGKFNETLLRSPLIVAEEETSMRLSQIRKLVGGLGIGVEKKHADTMDWRVIPRVTFSANDFSAFDATGLTSKSALSATADRFLFIDVNPAAGKILPQGDAWHEFCRVELPMHILWMRHNIKVQVTGRFAGVQGGVDAEAIIATQTNAASRVCEIALDWLTESRGVRAARGEMTAMLQDGNVYLGYRYVQQRWKEITGHAPSPKELAAGLGAAAESIRVLDSKRGSRPRWWRVSTNCLVQHVRNTNRMDEDELSDLLRGEGQPDAQPAKVIDMQKRS